MKAVLMFVVLFGSTLSAMAATFKVNDHVVTTRSTILTTPAIPGRTSVVRHAQLAPGTVLVVQKVNGNMLGVDDVQPGWVPSGDVATLEEGQVIFSDRIAKDRFRGDWYLDPGEVSLLRQNLSLNGESDADVQIVSRFASTAQGVRFSALDLINVDRSARGLVKVDVEGAELDVLHSGSDLLQPKMVDLLIETHSPEVERECVAWLTGRGYATEIIGNAWWRRAIPEYRPIEHNRWLWATSPSRLNR